MSVAVTPAIATASSSNTTSYASGAFTPAAGDRLVVFVYATGTVAAGSMSSSAGLTFTTLQRDGATDSMYVFYANQNAAASSQTVTFDCTGDAATGCVIMVFRVSGFGDTFTIVQSGFATFAASGTPTVTMGVGAFNTNNAGIGCAGNGTNPATLTPRTSWTESSSPLFDTGYTIPTTGMEGMYRNSGETASSIAWGGTSASAGKATVVEIKAGQYNVNAAASSYAITGAASGALADRMVAALAGAYTLAGAAATFVRGFVVSADGGIYTIAGSPGTCSADRLLSGDAGGYVLSGSGATTLADYLLNAPAGAYTLTGPDATLLAGRLLSGDAGAYVITGPDGTLEHGYVLVMDGGVYLLTGVDATLVQASGGYALNAESGLYALTGPDLSILADRLLAADAATYTLVGVDGTLLADYVIAALMETYLVSGADVSPIATRLLAALGGTYTISGPDAATVADRLLGLEAGTYAVSGADTDLLAFRLLTADGGSYQLSGPDAALLAAYLFSLDPGTYDVIGQDVHLPGRLQRVVRDQLGVPISGATVRVFLSATEAFVRATLSGADGKVIFVLEPGPYYLVGQDDGPPVRTGASARNLEPV